MAVKTEPVPVYVPQYVKLPHQLLVCEFGEVNSDMTWLELVLSLDEATAVCRANMKAIKNLQNKVIEND